MSYRIYCVHNDENYFLTQNNEFLRLKDFADDDYCKTFDSEDDADDEAQDIYEFLLYVGRGRYVSMHNYSVADDELVKKLN